MGFDLKEAKRESVKEKFKLYQVYEGAKGMYVTLGLAYNPIDKTDNVIFQQLGGDKKIQVLPIEDFQKKLVIVKKIRKDV